MMLPLIRAFALLLFAFVFAADAYAQPGPPRVALLLEGAADSDAALELAARDALGSRGVIVESKERVQAARTFTTTPPATPLDDAALERLRSNLRVDRVISIETKAMPDGQIAVAWLVADRGGIQREFATLAPTAVTEEVVRRIQGMPAAPPEPPPVVAVPVEQAAGDGAGEQEPEYEGEDEELEDESSESAPSRRLYAAGLFATDEVGYGAGVRTEFPLTEKIVLGVDAGFLYNSQSFMGVSASALIVPAPVTVGYRLRASVTDVVVRGGLALIVAHTSSESSFTGSMSATDTDFSGVVGSALAFRAGGALLLAGVDLYFKDGSFLLMSLGGGF